MEIVKEEVESPHTDVIPGNAPNVLFGVFIAILIVATGYGAWAFAGYGFPQANSQRVTSAPPVHVATP